MPRPGVEKPAGSFGPLVPSLVRPLTRSLARSSVAIRRHNLSLPRYRQRSCRLRLVRRRRPSFSNRPCLISTRAACRRRPYGSIRCHSMLADTDRWQEVPVRSSRVARTLRSLDCLFREEVLPGREPDSPLATQSQVPAFQRAPVAAALVGDLGSSRHLAYSNFDRLQLADRSPRESRLAMAGLQAPTTSNRLSL